MGSLDTGKYGSGVRTVDFARFFSDDAKVRARLCEELVGCLATVGFVKLINHGIGGDEIRQAFDINRRFFRLAPEAKEKAAHPPEPNPHRGYSYVGQEKLSMVKDYEKGSREVLDVFDVKESYDQGPAVDELYPNRWPDEDDVPGFRATASSFYQRCHEAHQDILRALAMGLGLGATFLLDLCEPNSSEMRLNHYPGGPVSAMGRGARRISEHTDFGTMTLLFQDSVGGLEVEDQRQPGSYFAVPRESPDEMIVNVGDCLQRWTNDGFRSASHRVVLPDDQDAWVDDRYSIAYFGKPSRAQPVGSRRELLRDGEEPRYENMTAWEYNQEKLVRTY
ncbi:2OG-Fe(II) oxygenase superfamily protein [Hirsutella rhossiliensis]|uniref:2OG-Fe(II) oxygenase superfamily domain-containing protein n=1 Tax=Hirsutella rhossiliensis TaxID=111463 RepID=A0A9P8SCY8_9HYPO|nr:2OG-Fe(II) oxygenase superfamily domain-containing protein [Hirsutella rhossiliensis]KAH0958158.1 2OG-Fe(II) oxygenase superfamily domain-containing protein [Hirsutella rhossiliensis]